MGREVTIRILYILGTFTIRISPDGCCHVPLGHVPGVRPKGLRASSRHPFPSSAPISRSFFFLSTSPSARCPLPFPFPSALCKAEIPQEKNGGDRNGALAAVGIGLCSRVKRGGRIQVTLRTLHPVSHVHLASALRIASGRASTCYAPLISDLAPDARNVGLTSKPRLTTKSLKIYAPLVVAGVFFNA